MAMGMRRCVRALENDDLSHGADTAACVRIDEHGGCASPLIRPGYSSDDTVYS